MGTRGGPQPGSGRPKGAITEKAQQILSKAALEGISPLEVLLNDMRFYYNLSEAEMAQVYAMEPGKKKANAFRAAGALKEIARSCARDAAPYLHPKLATISAPGGGPIQLSLEVSFVPAKG